MNVSGRGARLVHWLAAILPKHLTDETVARGQTVDQEDFLNRLRQVFREFARDSVDRATTSDLLEANFRRVAIYNTKSDRELTDLPSFEPAVSSLLLISLVQERYGDVSAAQRLTIQFAYEVLYQLSGSPFDDQTFTTVWDRFQTELQTPDWTNVAVANLKNFECDEDQLDLVDGVSIEKRSTERLALLLGQYGCDRLDADWMGWGFSNHVIVLRERQPKTPENVILEDSGQNVLTLLRTLRALRLLKTGEIRVGQVFFARPAAFDILGSGGSSSTILPGVTPRPGAKYYFDEQDVAHFANLYKALTRVEPRMALEYPNVAVAFRAFDAVYTRDPARGDDQILDAFIAIEALIGDKTETTFKVAFRIASILADTDDERDELFKKVKSYYDTRSRIVHGSSLEVKHRDLIEDNSPLIEVTRRVLRVFLSLAESNDFKLTPKFREQIDSHLLHSQKRDALRRSAGLT